MFVCVCVCTACLHRACMCEHCLFVACVHLYLLRDVHIPDARNKNHQVQVLHLLW
jgi:hypothetical protein